MGMGKDTLGYKLFEPWGGFQECNTTSDCFLPEFENVGRSTYICWPMFAGDDGEQVQGFCRCFSRARQGAGCSELSPLTLFYVLILGIVYIPVVLRSLYLVCRALVIHFEHRFNERMELSRLNLILVTQFAVFLLLLTYYIAELLDILINTPEIRAVDVLLTGLVAMCQFLPICIIAVTWSAIMASSLKLRYGVFAYNDGIRKCSSIIMSLCVIGYAVVYLIGQSFILYNMLLVVIQVVASLTLGILFGTTLIKLHTVQKAMNCPDDKQSATSRIREGKHDQGGCQVRSTEEKQSSMGNQEQKASNSSVQCVETGSVSENSIGQGNVYRSRNSSQMHVESQDMATIPGGEEESQIIDKDHKDNNTIAADGSPGVRHDEQDNIPEDRNVHTDSFIPDSQETRRRSKRDKATIEFVRQFKLTCIIIVCFGVFNVVAIAFVVHASIAVSTRATEESNLFITMWLLSWSYVMVTLVLILQLAALNITLKTGKLTRRMHFFPSVTRQTQRKPTISSNSPEDHNIERTPMEQITVV